MKDKIVLNEDDCLILEELFRNKSLYIYNIEIDKSSNDTDYNISFQRSKGV